MGVSGHCTLNNVCVGIKTVFVFPSGCILRLPIWGDAADDNCFDDEPYWEVRDEALKLQRGFCTKKLPQIAELSLETYSVLWTFDSSTAPISCSGQFCWLETFQICLVQFDLTRSFRSGCDALRETLYSYRIVMLYLTLICGNDTLSLLCFSFSVTLYFLVLLIPWLCLHSVNDLPSFCRLYLQRNTS